MTAPLDTVFTVPRRAFNPDLLPELTAAAAGHTGADHLVHLARYPAFGRRLREADLQVQSIPALAREIIQYTEQTVIPSAVDRQLRLSLLRRVDWEESAPRRIAAAAASDREALHELGCRMLGMAAWQDLDLEDAGVPINHFGSLQAQHEQLLDALGWVPPERLLPAARRAVGKNPALLDHVLGPSADAIIVWECEELIEMGLELLAAVNETRPVVGIYVEDAAMRRPYAESHSLLRALDAEGIERIRYRDLDFASAATPRKADERRPADATWRRASDVDSAGDPR